jgi:cell division protein FtsW
MLTFFLIIAPAIILLAKQPDSGSIVLIFGVSFIIYLLRGAPIKHIFSVVGIGVVLISVYISINPYIIERLKTFSDTSRDPYGSSYQIRQSKIAIGSGRLFGRGLGKSVHKFDSYLPESNSDSIFAIFSEEYGFFGSTILILLYIIFAFFGLKIAKKAPSIFAQNLVVGIILLIVIQVFLNIAAISGVIPLSGMPLIFMSNGGTALMVTLAELGIILNISRYMKKDRRRLK